MKERTQSGIFYCPECGTEREYSNTIQSGWSNSGFKDSFRFTICPRCGDNTPYDPGQPLIDPFRSRCPYCSKKTHRTTYCMHCGHRL